MKECFLNVPSDQLNRPTDSNQETKFLIADKPHSDVVIRTVKYKLIMSVVTSEK